MKKIILIILLLLATPALAATFMETSLKDGIGVRVLGMGGAFTGLADDSAATFYNPAGLGDFTFTVSSNNLDNNNDFAQANNYSTYIIGPFGYTNYVRNSLAGQQVRVTSYSLGRRQGWISWGLNYKNINFDLLSSSGTGYSTDVGMLFRLAPQLTVGLLSQDLMSDNFLNLNPSFRAGFSLRPFRFLTLAADWENRGGAESQLGHVGGELRVSDGVILRLGSNQAKATAGLGFEMPAFTINYAAQQEGLASKGVQHRLGVEFLPFVRTERPFSLVRPKEYALIEIGGNLQGGRGQVSIFNTRVGEDSIIKQIRDAAQDDSIDGIFLRIWNVGGGLGIEGIIQEIRSELVHFKQKGKKVVAYINNSAMGDEYYLAAVADLVICSPQGMIGGIARSLSVNKLKELFKKVGIEYQVIARGKYKAVFDGSTDLTKEQRDEISGIVSDNYRQMVNDIAVDRKIDLALLKEIADGRIFDVEEAKKLKLIDEIGYYEEAQTLAGKLLGSTDKAKMVSPQNVEIAEESIFPWNPKIVVIDIDGELVSGRNSANFLFGGRYIGADTICARLEKAADDGQVKAIILRLNTGGGLAQAADQIYRKVREIKEKNGSDKIIIASMGYVAASGGYYIACGADKIIANPGTIVGSIGVIGAVPVVAELYKKIGITTETFKEGKHADMFSGIRKLTPEERKNMEELQDKSYQAFLKAVVTGRKIASTEVSSVAEGRIFTGTQALDLKLVDELGGFSDAIISAKSMAKLTFEPQIVYYREGNLFLNVGFVQGDEMEARQFIGPQLKFGLQEFRFPGL